MNSETRPAVSVVMSVYNGLPYLSEAMDTLVAQTLDDVEFIVIDDGSSDGSREVLRAYAARDPRFRIIEQENTGLTRALIRGVDEARGEFIARMDADDLSEPQRLAAQLAALRAEPGAAAVTCALRRLRGDGSQSIRPPPSHPELIVWHLVFFNVIAGHGQIMFRKSAYEAAGGYDADFRYAQDYDLWERLFHVGSLATQEEAFYAYRDAHDNSITGRHRPAQDDCSYRVSERAYQRLTGETAARDTIEKLRLFWTFRLEFDLDTLACAAVQRALTTAFLAHVGKGALKPAEQADIRRIIAERWVRAAKLSASRRPGIAIASFQNALSWSPGAALRGASQIVLQRLQGPRRSPARPAGEAAR